MKKYRPDQYDLTEFVPYYDEVPLWSAPFGLRLLEQINYRKSIKALDIGFGNGFPLTELAMRLGETSAVYGIDPWKAATDRAKQKLRYYGIENVFFLEGVAEGIPLPDQSLDLVVSNNGLNNVEDLQKALSECSRVLRKGGQLVITLNTDKSMMEFYSTLEEVLLERKMKREVEKMHQHIYEKRRPEAEWVEMLQEAGLTVNSL
ncbi:MAG: class I SAM-dependent methyltransferase, partial [Bacteroidetes bacterium]|nr:class I SAM-dependent methyltransferase [Bacteroidota bacterium]